MIHKILLMVACFLVVIFRCSADDDIVGFWKTIDEKTKKPQSIVAIYENEGKYFGRMIVTYNDNGTVNDTIYNPKDRAPGVKGDPYYVGLDLIWNLKKEGSKYTNGSIIDPKRGYVYGAEVWRQGKDLVVRGELLFLGRNQTWLRATESDFPPGFKRPDMTKVIPVIPTVKP